MNDESISQAEIDALVKGVMGQDPAGDSGSGGAADPDSGQQLQKIMREFMQASAQALSDLVGVPCDAAVTSVTTTTALSANSLLTGHLLVGAADLTEGVSGMVFQVMPNELGLAIITQLYGGVAPSYMDESALGALSEGLAQMNHAGFSRLSGYLGRPIGVTHVEATSVNAVSEAAGLVPSASMVIVSAEVTVGDITDPVLVLISEEAVKAVVEAAKAPKAPKPKAAAPEPVQHAAAAAATTMSPAAASGTAHKAGTTGAGTVPYQTAMFPDLSQKARPDDIRNIDLLMDVSLQVTVELGRTRKQIRDVLALGPGSVVELDKLAGEQVDVLVNGKLIAKGEVVVIDENYGVRITDIISPADRVQSLK